MCTKGKVIRGKSDRAVRIEAQSWKDADCPSGAAMLSWYSRHGENSCDQGGKQMSEKIRCPWANPKNPLSIRYHDEEWGVPVHDDHKLFEMLILENFQAGLSWECILNKREAFRQALDGFDL